jgi:acyl-CoA synthetase (NDP forming)
MADRHFLTNFMEPESVALIGISRRTGRGAFNILESLMDYGYQGHIYPVNPHTDEILGVRCLADVALLPESIDLADALDYLKNDADTRVIVLYAEETGNRIGIFTRTTHRPTGR